MPSAKSQVLIKIISVILTILKTLVKVFTQVLIKLKDDSISR